MLMMAGTENCSTSFGMLAVPKELRRWEFKVDIAAPNIAKGECYDNAYVGHAKLYAFMQVKTRL